MVGYDQKSDIQTFSYSGDSRGQSVQAFPAVDNSALNGGSFRNNFNFSALGINVAPNSSSDQSLLSKIAPNKNFSTSGLSTALSSQVSFKSAPDLARAQGTVASVGTAAQAKMTDLTNTFAAASNEAKDAMKVAAVNLGWNKDQMQRMENTYRQDDLFSMAAKQLAGTAVATSLGIPMGVGVAMDSKTALLDNKKLTKSEREMLVAETKSVLSKPQDQQQNKISMPTLEKQKTPFASVNPKKWENVSTAELDRLLTGNPKGEKEYKDIAAVIDETNRLETKLGKVDIDKGLDEGNKLIEAVDTGDTKLATAILGDEVEAEVAVNEGIDKVEHPDYFNGEVFRDRYEDVRGRVELDGVAAAATNGIGEMAREIAKMEPKKPVEAAPVAKLSGPKPPIDLPENYDKA